MPRISLDTAANDSQTTSLSANESWCERIWTHVKKSSYLTAAVALIGLSADSADAQVMQTPVYSDTGAQAVWPANAPQNAQPWPGVSPYHSANVLSTQHVNQNGLWMKNVYQKNREFYFSAEAAFFDFGKAGEKVVGATPLDGALTTSGQLIGGQVTNPSDVIIDDLQLDGSFSGSALTSLFDQVPGGFVLEGPGVFPYPLLSFDDTDADESTLDFVGNSTAYPIRTLDDIPNGSAVGTRLRWGFDNGDGSGFELTGFISGEGTSDFTRGVNSINGQPINIVSYLLNSSNLTSLQNGAVPIDNGLPTFPVLGDSLGITGATQKYDVFYQIKQTTQVGGVGASIFNTPVLDRKAARIRFVWGGDYVFVDEQFGFRGIDSGRVSDLEDYQSDAGQLPGGTGGGGGGGNNDVLDSRFTDGQEVIPTLTPNSPNPFFESWISSKTQSHLFGPTLGFRYDFGGGKKFLVWGETIVGLMANFEQTIVESENFAEVSHSKAVYGLDPFNEADGTPRPADFTRSRDDADHVHVTPMFKQGIHGELALECLVPKLKSHPFISEGFITAGYTVTVLGEMQRPGEAIIYRGYNGDQMQSFPYATVDRSTFVISEANLGIEWQY